MTWVLLPTSFVDSVFTYRFVRGRQIRVACNLSCQRKGCGCCEVAVAAIMEDRIELLSQQLQATLGKLNWEECCEQTNLGGLDGMTSLLTDASQRKKVLQLGSITPLFKNQPLPGVRESLEVEDVLTYNKRGPKKIASLQLAQLLLHKSTFSFTKTFL